MCERCGFTRQPGATPWPEQNTPWAELPYATRGQVEEALATFEPREEDWGPNGVLIQEQHGRLLVRIGQTETDRTRLDVRDALGAARIPYRSYGSGGLIEINTNTEQEDS